MNSRNSDLVSVEIILEFLPPLIRESLLSDPEFVTTHRIATETSISFSPDGGSFRRSDLFANLREALSKNTSVNAKDLDGNTYTVHNDSPNSEQPKLIIATRDRQIAVPGTPLFSPSPSVRLHFLEQSAQDVNLPVGDKLNWENILRERPVTDDEYDTFLGDLRSTPVGVERTIQQELRSGVDVSKLVPGSLTYYERLVGTYDGSETIVEYAQAEGRKLITNLSQWSTYRGLLFALVIASHSSMVEQIDIGKVDDEDLRKVYESLSAGADIQSKLAGIELGLRILRDKPFIEPHLLQLLHSIRDDDPNNKWSEYHLFSALAIMVDGELARNRIFAGKPPFYRRLASFAQASVIHRLLVRSNIDRESFATWALDKRVEYFYLQSLIDLRAEPRWTPDLLAPLQLQAEFLGRVMNSGQKYAQLPKDGELAEIVLGQGENSLFKRSEFPRQYFPGPLEGGGENPNPPPDDLLDLINQELDRDNIKASSYIALINSARLFTVPPDQIQLAVDALKQSHSQLDFIDDIQLVGILSGLAAVAAVSRNHELASQVWILVRRYRNSDRFDLNIAETLKICLVAAASHFDATGWRTHVGKWITELAFSELDGTEGEVLRSNLSVLLHCEPELWITCSRAEAALASLSRL